MNKKQVMSRIIKACKGTILEDRYKVIQEDLVFSNGEVTKSFKIYIAGSSLVCSWTPDCDTLEDAFNQTMEVISQYDKIR